MRLFQALRKHVLKTGHSSNLVTRTPPRNEVGKAFFKKLGFCPIFQDKNPERIYYVFN